jgi:hypothetical protein
MMHVAVSDVIYACSESFYTSSLNVSMIQQALRPPFHPNASHATPVKSNIKCRNLLIRPGKVPKIPVHQFTANFSF